MNVKRICALYFSATGTTKKVVTTLANELNSIIFQDKTDNVEIFDVSLPSAREKVYCFGAEDLVICGFPVYAGRVPNLLLPFVKGNIKGENTLCIPVSTFGNRNFDDALIELKQILESNGFTALGAGAFSCEHSFSTQLGKGRPDADDLKEIAFFADALSVKLLDIIKNGIKPPYFTVSGNPELPAYYTPRDRNGNGINILKVKPLTDPEKCVSCGTCASVCTMGSIDPADFSNIIGKCTKCCACVKACPMGAKYYDDEGYLYHKSELEAMYGGRRAPNSLFY